MPGSSPTIERRVPVNRLNSVDFPTFGRPQIATSGSYAFGAATPSWFELVPAPSPRAAAAAALARLLRTGASSMSPTIMRCSFSGLRFGTSFALSAVAFFAAKFLRCFGETAPVTAPPRRAPLAGPLPSFGRVLACRCFLPIRFFTSRFGAIRQKPRQSMVARTTALPVLLRRLSAQRPNAREQGTRRRNGDYHR